MSSFKDFNNMSDLEKLYKILNIDVNNIEQKDTFSPEVANSKHDPTEFNKEDASLVKVKVGEDKPKKGIYAYILDKYNDPTLTNSDSASGGEDVPRWSALTHVYIGSLTIIGLYAVFRALQKS